MRVRVRWFDVSNSSIREELLDAPSPEAARAGFGASGKLVLAVQEIRSKARTQSWLNGQRLDVAWWCREVRVLLVAGMTVVEAIDTLRVQIEEPSRALLHDRLALALQQGQSLSAAMAGTGAFPPVLLAGVIASERSGALVDALDDFLRYHELIDALKRKLVSAAVYPALVLAVGLAVVLFLLWFVVPRFSAMYANTRGSLDGATGLLMGASSVLRSHGLLLALLFGMTLAGIAWVWRQGLLGPLAARAADAVPAVRRRLDEFRLAKLYQAVALMFRGGYALDEALKRCATLGLGPRFTAGVGQAHGALGQGRRVSSAMHEAGLTDAVSHRLLQVGERTGNFDQVLQTIAERHAQRFSTIVERTTRLAEPLLLLLVATAVGGVVVLMYMPVFDLAGAVR